MGNVIFEMIAQLLGETLSVTPAWARGCTWALITVAVLALCAALVMIFG
jgi:hypothetical protein